MLSAKLDIGLALVRRGAGGTLVGTRQLLLCPAVVGAGSRECGCVEGGVGAGWGMAARPLAELTVWNMGLVQAT